MALSNKEKSKALRNRRSELGLKELRNIWITPEQEAELRIKIKRWISSNFRQSTDS